MKLPGGMDLGAMMRQAQQMKEEMGRQMKSTVVDASSGGGAVQLKMRGDFELLELKIAPELLADGDAEMLQDLILAAFSEGKKKVEEAMKSSLGGMLPPGLGL